MKSNKQQKILETAKALTPYCVTPEEYHFSAAWADKLIAGWIALKRQQVEGEWDNARFREALIALVIELSDDWTPEFLEAAHEAGISFDCVSAEAQAQMQQAYIQANRERAFDLIPSNLHGELCWVPGWDGFSLDTLMEEIGLRSTRFRSNYLEDVRPGRWLVELLKLGNCSSEALRAHCMGIGDAGRSFSELIADRRWKVEADPLRPAVLSPENVVTIIENAIEWAAPMAHAEINVRALFEHDCTTPMFWSTAKGKVHIGLHDGVLSGAGYMDAYDGYVLIPANETGFAGEARWHWGINKVYGVVKSYFKVTPIEVRVIDTVASAA